jgi:hypothetical protein
VWCVLAAVRPLRRWGGCAGCTGCTAQYERGSFGRGKLGCRVARGGIECELSAGVVWSAKQCAC